MTFTSVAYLALLGVVALLHAFAARWGSRVQNGVLLAAGALVAGAVHPWFALVMGVVVGVNAACAARVQGGSARRRGWLALAVAVTIGALALFKYLDFFRATLGFSGSFDLLAPLGISFFTLQSLGYTLDVARGEVDPEPDLLTVATFGSFFPSIASGPISRADDLMPQFRVPRRPTAEGIESAILLMAWGFFKKLVVAETLAPIVDKVFALRDPSFPLMLAAAPAFTLQLYADFSACTDIARGSARLLGVNLAANFDAPLLAPSLTSFWARWHRTLTGFLRDHVYVPLAGDRPTALRMDAALLGTFLVSGLWHGAGLNFVVWGAYNGAILLLERAWARAGLSRLTAAAWTTPFTTAATFAFVAIGLVIFRETGGLGWVACDLLANPRTAPADDWIVARYLAVIVAVWGLPMWISEVGQRVGWHAPRGWARAMLVLMLVAATRVLATGEARSFIYAGF